MEPSRSELVKALAKPGNQILDSLNAHKCHLLHMAIGICGEAGEILEADSAENILEELGDSYFYFEGLMQGLQMSAAELQRAQNVILRDIDYSPWAGRESISCVVVYASRILDEVKKYTVYNKPEINMPHLLQHMIRYVYALRSIRDQFGFTDSDVHGANLKKLGKRYASLTYTDTAALGRADKVEEPSAPAQPERNFIGMKPEAGVQEHSEIMNEITHSGAND